MGEVRLAEDTRSGGGLESSLAPTAWRGLVTCRKRLQVRPTVSAHVAMGSESEEQGSLFERY